jgi:small subunit ribosomal protein S2
LVTVTMKELLEAGVHFGHQVRRWNPKMKEYIFGERNGIYIIDLQKTQKMFREALAAVSSMVAEDRGKTVLFVGTKRQAQDAVREEAERSGQYYVNQRWLGGLLTNFQTVQKSIKRLKDLEAMQTDGRYEKLTKKERIKLDRERLGLEKVLSGIKSMNRLPDAVFVIDVRKEEIAVAEANKLGIPVIAVVDTNCSPEGIDYVIPGNDDALRAVRLFASRIADAVLEGQQMLTEGGASAPEPAAVETLEAAAPSAGAEPESPEAAVAVENTLAGSASTMSQATEHLNAATESGEEAMSSSLTGEEQSSAESGGTPVEKEPEDASAEVVAAS